MAAKLLREFEVEKILGTGAFGMVIKAKNKFDTTSYAIKLQTASQDTSTNEIQVFSKISSHHNVVAYKASWIETLGKWHIQALMKDLSIGEIEAKRFNLDFQASSIKILCIQMELCGQDLRSVIQKSAGKGVNDRKAWKMFGQMLKGLRHIHHHNIIHRDLKPENIFVCNDNVVKIGDLGISKALPENVSLENNTVCGTRLYMAPEQILRNYGRSVDIYALGLILAELFLPLKELPETVVLIFGVKIGRLPESFRKNFAEICELILQMVKGDPNERLNLDGAIASYKKIKLILANDRHDGVSCDGCKKEPIRRIRYKCKSCKNFDLCDECIGTFSHDPSHTFTKMTEAMTDEVNVRSMFSLLLALGIGKPNQCFRCGESPLKGNVFKCNECPCAYYCRECFKNSGNHTKIHKFTEVRI